MARDLSPTPMAVLLAALAACDGNPEGAVLRQVREWTGEEPSFCGGPRYDEPEASLDGDCVAHCLEASLPVVYWTENVTLTEEGAPIYNGRAEFHLDEDLHFWQLADHRADPLGNGFFVTRCRIPAGPNDAECAETECLADCKGNGA